MTTVDPSPRTSGRAVSKKQLAQAIQGKQVHGLAMNCFYIAIPHDLAFAMWDRVRRDGGLVKITQQDSDNCWIAASYKGKFARQRHEARLAAFALRERLEAEQQAQEDALFPPMPNGLTVEKYQEIVSWHENRIAEAKRAWFSLDDRTESDDDRLESIVRYEERELEGSLTLMRMMGGVEGVCQGKDAYQAHATFHNCELRRRNGLHNGKVLALT